MSTKTLLDVAKLAHLGGNRNVRTADGMLLNVEGFRGETGGRWVTVFRGGHGPYWIDPETAAGMTVTDLGRRK